MFSYSYLPSFPPLPENSHYFPRRIRAELLMLKSRYISPVTYKLLGLLIRIWDKPHSFTHLHLDITITMKSSLSLLCTLAIIGTLAAPLEQSYQALPVDKTVQISGLSREQQGRMFIGISFKIWAKTD